MIITRYFSVHIYKGVILVLLTLVSLSLFFTFIRELDDVGKGQYGLIQLAQFLFYKIPNVMVEFMPLAALIGAMLSLGNLASNSEIIALQTSGMSIKKLLYAVGFPIFTIALTTFLIAEYLVPTSEMRAKNLRSSSLTANVSLQAREGVWIKDEQNIIFIQKLFPNGSARHVDIYHLNDAGRLLQTTHAQQALVENRDWYLIDLERTTITPNKTQVSKLDRQLYQGKVTDDLLVSLAVTPQQMSVSDLRTYIQFLHENNLNAKAESLSFWRKIYAPITIMVMGLLAAPFLLGSQRHSNTGTRLMMGIMIGLGFVVLNRLLIQLGEQMEIKPMINALMPTLIFMALTIWLIWRKINSSGA